MKERKRSLGERHVAAGFPITDGLGLLELARKRRFRTHIQPEGQVRAQRHGVELEQVLAVDAANRTAGDQGIDKSVGQDDHAGTQRGDDAVFELVEEIGGIHQHQGHARHGILGH